MMQFSWCLVAQLLFVSLFSRVSCIRNLSHSMGVLVEEVKPPTGPVVVWKGGPNSELMPSITGRLHQEWSPVRYMDTISHCNITIKDGVLFHFGPEEDLTLITVAGSVNLNSNSLLGRTFFGPVKITGRHCTTVLVGLDICSHDSGHFNDLSHSCASVATYTKLKVSIACFTLILLSAIVLRYSCVRFHKQHSGFRLVSGAGGAFKFTLMFRENEAGGASFFRKKGEMTRASAWTDRKTEDNRYIAMKFNWKTLLLTMLLIHNFSEITIVKANPNYKTLSASEGDQFDLANSTVRVNQAHHYSPLTLLYKTAPWLVTERPDWHCYMSQCDKVKNCLDVETTGHRLHDQINISAAGTGVITSLFCEMNSGGCFSGFGCYRWEVDYFVNMEHEALVFKADSPIEVTDVVISGPEDIQIVEQRLVDAPSMTDKTIVRVPTGEYYHCPFHGSKASPVAGQLGDLQYNDHLFYSLSQDITKCTTQPKYGIKCSNVAPFYPNIPNACKRLPSTIEGYEVSMDQSGIQMKKTDNIRIIVESSRPLPSLPSTTGCGQPKVSLWGARYSGEAIWVMITSDGYAPLSTGHYFLPCSQQNFSYSCTKKPSIHEVSQMHSCSGFKDGLINNLVDQEEMSYMKETTSHFLAGNEGWGFLSALSSWSPLSAAFHLSGGVLVASVLGSILLCVKK